jgi:hypothetical protein
MRPAVLLLLCATLAGCGSGGPKRLSKQEYARRADAICAFYQRLTAAFGTPSNTRQLARVAARTVQALDTAIAGLRRLRPPASEQPLAEQWLASLSTLRRDVVHLRDRARANDLAGIRRLVAPAQRHDRTSARLAARLGMVVCSKEAG